jgi:hypothetical protein
MRTDELMKRRALRGGDGKESSTVSVAGTDATDGLEAGFTRAFGLVAFVMNRHLVDHMVRSSRSFGIDYQTMVLWAVLSHQNCAHLYPPGALPSEVLSDDGTARNRNEGMLRPVRLRHLSEMTGVPRETARRKLAALRRAGWITATPLGWVIVPESIDADVRRFTLESTRRFLTAAAEVRHALRDAGYWRPDR